MNIDFLQAIGNIKPFTKWIHVYTGVTWRMYTHFSKFAPMKRIEVVAGIIKDGNKIFATQRGYGEQKGFWEFPGGKMECGETPQQTLERELKEELAIHVNVGDFLCTVEHDYPAFHLTMHCYFCTIVGGKAPELLEHEAAKWLAPAELHSVDWLPADIKVVEAIEAQ